jgi:hypothetical protein
MKLAILLFMVFVTAMTKADVVTKEEIVAWSQKYNYDKPLLVVAIADAESKYNPRKFRDELSGSYGLMQVQCQTAKSPSFGDQALKGRCDQLFDPETNVKYGILWLKYVEASLLVPSIKNVISGYNAGFDVNNKKCGTNDGSRCTQWLYATRRCKFHSTFNYPGMEPQKCAPGQYINEQYVTKLFRLHIALQRQDLSASNP